MGDALRLKLFKNVHTHAHGCRYDEDKTKTKQRRRSGSGGNGKYDRKIFEKRMDNHGDEERAE